MRLLAASQWFVVALLLTGFVFIDSVQAQGKNYRKPSESDIEWLLGSGKPKSSSRRIHCDEVNACQPASCGGLRNPACSCADCRPSDPCDPARSAPLPPSTKTPRRLSMVPLESDTLAPETSGSVATLETTEDAPPVVAVPPAETGEGTIAQTAGEKSNLKAPESPGEFPADVPLEEVVEPSVTSKPTPLSAAPLPQNKAPASKVAAQPLSTGKKAVAVEDTRIACAPARPSHCSTTGESKGMSCVSSFGASGDCSCERCRGHVDEIVASTLIGDCLRKITCLHRARSVHSDCCNCWLCTELDTPDMIGDAAWIPGRYAGHVAGGNSLFSTPTALMSRLNIAEHFNAEARDRIWVDYRHLNGATLAGMSEAPVRYGAVDQFTFGLEKKVTACSSLELRVPVINQFDSTLDRSNYARTSAEIGNLSLVYKYVFTRSSDFTFTGGVGLAFPTADDWTITETSGKLKNKHYYVVPYFGLQWHPNDSTFGHALIQLDLPVGENELLFGSQRHRFEEATAVRVGLQVGRWFYRNERGSHSCRLGGFFEVDYTAATDHPENVLLTDTDHGILAVYSPNKKPQPVNLIAGIPVQFGRLSLTNAVIVPVTSNDRQFCVAYSFSLSRQF